MTTQNNDLSMGYLDFWAAIRGIQNEFVGSVLSMLVNKKFDLTLMKLKIPTQEAQDIHFKGEAFISDVDGDLSD